MVFGDKSFRRLRIFAFEFILIPNKCARIRALQRIFAATFFGKSDTRHLRIHRSELGDRAMITRTRTLTGERAVNTTFVVAQNATAARAAGYGDADYSLI